LIFLQELLYKRFSSA